MLRGHEPRAGGSALQLIADFTGVVRGWQLRTVREAFRDLDEALDRALSDRPQGKCGARSWPPLLLAGDWLHQLYLPPPFYFRFWVHSYISGYLRIWFCFRLLRLFFFCSVHWPSQARGAVEKETRTNQSKSAKGHFGIELEESSENAHYNPLYSSFVASTMNMGSRWCDFPPPPLLTATRRAVMSRARGAPKPLAE